MGKLIICSLVVMTLAGVRHGMTARAEEIIDSENEMQAVTEMVPESEHTDALPAEVPAAQEDAQEAGVDLMQVVVIGENMVPGAAQPEAVGEAADAQESAEAPGEDPETDEAELPEASDDAQDEAEALEGSEDEQAEETGVSGTITYEDSEVVITVAASGEAQLPADTEVKVVRLEEGSEKYEEAKEAARQSLAAGETADYTFYDITLESEGQALDVEEGTVSVRMEFKTDAETRDVVSIEETENGKVARSVTDPAAEESAGSVELSY